MLTTFVPIIAAFFLRSGLTFPFPFTNSTYPNNGTNCKRTFSNHTTCHNNNTVPQYDCEYTYPADLSILNARYPEYNRTHLHRTTTFFMLRREVAEVGEIATRVQFHDLPAYETNTMCRLEFILPELDLQFVNGFNPTFNIYQVERDPDSIATWKTYQGNSGAPLFGRVNGEPAAIERTRSVGGVAAINEMRCNDTLTFQMGMAFNSINGVPNYWEFTQVSLPALPVQGFRIVYGC